MRAAASSKTLTTCVPSEPANSLCPPIAFSPAMRPCLWAVVPKGRYIGRSSRRCQVSTQSPAAKTPGTPVRIRRSTDTAWRFPRVTPAVSANSVLGRTLTAMSTRSARRRKSGEPSTNSIRPSAVIPDTVVPVTTSTPWRDSSAATSPPSSGSTVVSTKSDISTSVTSRPRWVSASAISTPM